MPLSADVLVSEHEDPEWPGRCMRCLRPDPDDSVKVRATSVGWQTLGAFFIPILAFFGWRGLKRDVPVCSACIDAVRRDRRLRFVAMWLPAGVVISLAIEHDWFERGRWFMVGIIIAAIAPAIAWDIFHPPWVDATREKPDRIRFEFRNHDFAELFAEANDSEVE